MFLANNFVTSDPYFILYYLLAMSHLWLCVQVDKDFVWSLWKEAQQELPDVSAIIDMVIAK